MVHGLLRRLARTDWMMFMIAVALLTVGLVMVYSSSYHFQLMGWADVTSPTYHVMKQMRFAALGLGFLVVGWIVDYHLYRRFAVPILIATLAILSIMAFVGRWVAMTQAGGVIVYGSVQPVEAAKIGAIIYIAVWLESRREQLKQFSMGTAPFMLILGSVAGLIMAQRDLSTAVLLAATATVMFFVAGANMKHFALYLIFGALMVAIPIFVFGYGHDRYQIWVEGPYSDPTAKGYQILHSLRALSLGGFSGVGLGQSGQKMFLGRFSHTDFIFAIIAEEFGFLGSVAVIGLYALWVWRGFTIARNAPDMYGRLLAIGLVCWTAFQATLSIAVATNSVPVTGTVLPFMSYGGSSLVSALGAVGILLNISRSGQQVKSGGVR
ncbi:MAG: FtsW/RodA/SpoVE family cell cycle protein [Anaerolineae bacterium]|jgi:cell division protein FtsW|nr:cell division protein FtsW [Chloroflexota bacterium]